MPDPLRHRIQRLICGMLFVLIPATARQAFKPDDVLKVDPAITTGSFANGLRYYIKQNKKPEKRAELRLAIRTGSVMEDDDQQGLAHFVEHMCFNGTKKFPKQDIVNFLEKTGVRFGPHLNAYTSFDETVYMMQVPTDSTAVLHKAFEILEEWAHNVSFDTTEINKERGVVVEEWRLGRGAFERIANKHNPILFYNSRYAQRLPIGKKDVLEKCSYETLTRFYHDWYRPDLMAVIAVGDFEKSEIEKLVKEHFAGLVNPDHERDRTKYKLPDHEQTLASVATDAELPYASVGVYFKRDKQDEKTAGDYRRSIVNGIYDGMLNARLQELLQKPNPPFVFAQTGLFPFVGGKQGYMLFAAVKENSIIAGLETLLTEAFKVEQHGFTATELDRQKKESLRFIEQAYKEREKTESRSYAEEYIRNYLQDEPIPGIAVENELYKQFVPGIRLAEIDQQAPTRLTAVNRIVTISAPKKEGVVIPPDSAVLALMKGAGTKKTEAYVDIVINKPLIEKLPKPGSVTATKTLGSIGVTEWTLSNGAHVVLRPTDFKNDEVLFSAYSVGGTSLADDKDFVSAQQAATVVAQGGAGEFDDIALTKMLAGKVANVSPGISELSENFSGNASPQDLETFFQLIHLYFTSPRKDTGAANAYLSRIKAFLANRKVYPEAAFQDTAQVTMAQYHYRARPMTPEILNEVNLDRAFAFYKNRYADASDFIFFFVGSFQPEKLKPPVEQYLATLPSLHRKESWRDVGMRYPKGVIAKEVRKGIEPKSMVQMNFTGGFDWTQQNRYDFDALLEVFRIKLREVLREDRGGVYGVGVSGSPSQFPRKEYKITIQFGCSPDRVDELTSTALQQIDSLKVKPADAIYVTKVKELQRRDREVNLKENRWWLSTLRVAYANGEDPERMNDFGGLVDKLTSEAIQKAARRYFDMQNYVKIVLYPEKK